MIENEEETVRRLLEQAGPRPPIPREDLDAIASAARLAWKRQVRSQGQPRASRTLWIGLAAVLTMIAGLAAWWALQREPIPWIEAGASPVHLELADGATARLDVDTRLRFLSPAVLEMERGAVYLDTGEGPHAVLEVRTPVGTVRDIGTRFAVRVVEPRGILVRVRDGKVLTEHHGRTDLAEAGEELLVRSDGTAERRQAAPYGPGWDWVLQASPGFDVEGRTLREFLDWTARETGWRIVFADPGLADSAAKTVLHGSTGKLPPDQAPFAVLPGAGLEGELKDGTLMVRRR